MVKSSMVEIEGHSLKVSNLDKIMYPATGTTKADVMDYYLQVAPVLIPQSAWRSATRKRWVDGVGTKETPGKVFFRKDLEPSAPNWIPTGKLEHRSGTTTYPLVNNAAVLAWFAQVAALEVHVPQWRFNNSGAQNPPDRLVIDLDPGPGAGLPECAEVAQAVREILTEIGLAPVPVTSGSKGIHLYAPLDGQISSDRASAIARRLAEALEKDLPDLVVATQRKTERTGKVLVDWSQNNAAKTTVCPYSLRGRDQPTVAAPRTWEELQEPNLRQLSYQEVLERVKDGIDPLASQGWDATGAPPDDQKLDRYREKRSADRTPEPVPPKASPTAPARVEQKSTEPRPEDGRASFVIQEHHASRLHWDFRLERDGVLVSWAVPKGPPLSPKPHRLAVQTEDHPLEYGSFEGVIPKGEYGGGTVTIWDAGWIDVEKWRDDEIITVLHGRRGGGLGGEPRRYALVRTRGKGEKSQWLLIFTKDQPGSDDEAEVASSNSRATQAPTEPAKKADLPPPMLATLGKASDIRNEDDWAFEMKWDGVRAICGVEGGEIRIMSRNGNDVTARYPELAELAESVAGEAAVLDGEIVALDENGRPDFSLLQPRMHADPKKAALMAKQNPVSLMLFDALSLTVEGKEHDLLRAPYRQRRDILAQAVSETDRIKVPSSFPGDLEQAVAHSKEQHLEGVVAKQLTSAYMPGKRSEQWIKLKERHDQSVLIVGWRVGEDGRLRSLLLAIPNSAGDLEYVGRVGSGISARAAKELEELLPRLERKTAPVSVPGIDRKDARWVSPKLVGEVKYAERTRGGRLRNPVWRGLRTDISPGDVRWE